jgi:hypothetical protein
MLWLLRLLASTWTLLLSQHRRPYLLLCRRLYLGIGSTRSRRSHPVLLWRPANGATFVIASAERNGG